MSTPIETTVLTTADVYELIHKETGRCPALPFPSHWKLELPYSETGLTKRKALADNLKIPVLFDYPSTTEIDYDLEGSPLVILEDNSHSKSFSAKKASIPVIKLGNEWIVSQDLKLKRGSSLTLVVRWNRDEFAKHGLDPDTADIEKEIGYFFEIARDHLTQLVRYGGYSKFMLRNHISAKEPDDEKPKRGRAYYTIDLGYGWVAYGDVRDKANVLSSEFLLKQQVIRVLTSNLPVIGV